MTLFNEKIVPHLLKIAGRSKNPLMLDTPEEKAQAGIYLLKEWQKVDRDSEEAEEFKKATDALLTDHYLLVSQPSYNLLDPTYTLLEKVTYLSIVNERISEIAGRSGERHLIDSEGEKIEVMDYLNSIKDRLVPCEADIVEKSLRILLSSERVQFNPCDNFVLDSLCANKIFWTIEKFIAGVNTFFTPVNDRTYASYVTTKAGKCGCEDKGWGKGCCTETESREITLSRQDIEKAFQHLKEATSPEEERLKLLLAVRQFPGFPTAEDCVHQSNAAKQILWLASTLGYLKWHHFSPTLVRFIENREFRHFASGVISNEDNRLWMIDTWATNPECSILPYEVWTNTPEKQFVK